MLGLFAILATVIPENWKEAIMNFLIQPQWINFVALAIFCFLIVAYSIFLSHISQNFVVPKDIGKINE